jgi:endoglycosylceramidase
MLKNTALFSVLTFFAFAAISNAGTNLDRIKIKGNYYVDESNRVVLFRGINAVQKSFPWIPQYGHLNLKNLTQLDFLQSWGFNCIRLGVMWSGVFPQRDVLNQSYIQEMSDIMDKLASRGIYVIIDLHQDMLSSKFDSYDGAPLWALSQIPNPPLAYPWPFKTHNLGFGAYATSACGFAFQCLYDNVNGFQNAFHLYWTTVAGLFKNRTSVLAYELINEPWAGDIYTNPLLLLPGKAGVNNLMPFYDNAYDRIRSIDKDTIIMYEPVTWATMSTSNLTVRTSI